MQEDSERCKKMQDDIRRCKTMQEESEGDGWRTRRFTLNYPAEVCIKNKIFTILGLEVQDSLGPAREFNCLKFSRRNYTGMQCLSFSVGTTVGFNVFTEALKELSWFNLKQPAANDQQPGVSTTNFSDQKVLLAYRRLKERTSDDKVCQTTQILLQVKASDLRLYTPSTRSTYK